MSRIGRMPIPLPPGVEVTQDGASLSVRGPLGTLQREIHPDMLIERGEGQLRVVRPSDEPKHRALHGLTRTLVNNMVVGVTTGFTKGLEISGVGYRAQLQGPRLVLALGYSHPVEVDPPAGISFQVETPTRLSVVGPTRSWSARRRPSSGRAASPSPTRARASDTRARSSCARPARPARSGRESR